MVDESALPFEERYEDVLQNIEFGIIRVYREHPELSDWEALTAVEALMRTYQAEAKGRQAKSLSLAPLAQQVYDSARAMCELRLGREALQDKKGKPMELGMQPLSLDEIIACPKRIRKSINRWSKEGGRQGYLTFVDQFIAQVESVFQATPATAATPAGQCSGAGCPLRPPTAPWQSVG